MDLLSNLLLLVLGWLLGTLSPGVVDAIGRRKRRADLLAVIATELHELRFLLALVLVRVHSKLRTMDQPALDLIRPILLQYHGDADDVPLLDATKKLLSKGDTAFIALHNAPGNERAALYPIPYDAPFLTTHLGDLALFPVHAQQRLLRIVTELRLFNEQVAQVQTAHNRTFDSSLTAPNYVANNQNLQMGTAKLASRAAALIAAVNHVVGSDGKPCVEDAR